MGGVTCPDCEMSVDRLMPATGICIKCYKRQLYKQKNNQEYTPLKSIKGTAEYNKAMSKRLGSTKRKLEEKIEKTTTSKTTNKVYKVDGYEYIDLVPEQILEAITFLNNALKLSDKMNSQANNMTEELLLISHKKTNTNGPGDKEYEDLLDREFSILKYRRQLKDCLVYLGRIDARMLNDGLIGELQSAKERILETDYKPKYDSKAKKYNVSVNIIGMYGSKQTELFKRLVFADNEIEAKAYVNDYLQKLSSVTILGKSWRIEEIKEDSNDTNT